MFFKLKSFFGIVCMAVITSATGKPITLVCKINYTGHWYASELREKYQDFGTLIYQLDETKKLIRQTWGDHVNEPISVAGWSNVEIEFKQKNAAASIADGELIGYRKTTINRLSGNFVVWPIYTDTQGIVLSEVELDLIIKRKGLDHPFLAPPRNSETGTCEAKKQAF